MKKLNANDPKVYDRVQVILASAQTHAARSVNSAQVVANWLIGREIVEEQQQGAKRAGYGQDIIAKLAADLRGKGVSGYGELTLKLCRQFFLSYPDLPGTEIGYALRNQLGQPSGKKPIIYALRKQLAPKADTQPIGHALSSQSTGAMILVPQIIESARSSEWKPGLLHPSLSWTHYRALMRVTNPPARAFYEIEATQQNWNARETERQIQSLLFERLAKSRDKKGVMALATKGHVVQTPADVFKDPVVIEFLGLPESYRLVETKLEEALISNLQQFLLELGKGCPMFELFHHTPALAGPYLAAYAADTPEASEAQQRDFLTHSESMKYESRMMKWSRLSGAFSSVIIHPSSLPLLLLAVIKQEGRV